MQAVSEPAPILIEQPTDNSADEAAIEAWQEYATDLENTVNTMQQREGEYQTQLESANQTIINLQDQVNSANAAASAPANYEDDYEEYDDDDEHDEYEHEDDDEHEHEEHEDDDD